MVYECNKHLSFLVLTLDFLHSTASLEENTPWWSSPLLQKTAVMTVQAPEC